MCGKLEGKKFGEPEKLAEGFRGRGPTPGWGDARVTAPAGGKRRQGAWTGVGEP